MLLKRWLLLSFRHNSITVRKICYAGVQWCVVVICCVGAIVGDFAAAAAAAAAAVGVLCFPQKSGRTLQLTCLRLP